jgi:hypothetical protein
MLSGELGNRNAKEECAVDRCLSSALFTASFSGATHLTQRSYKLISAHEADFKEEWLQRAIAENPELVLAPCRAACLISEDEVWKFWGREVHVDEVGDIDVLLVSDSGRVAIVETKLAYNPEARREVLAQVLDYAVHLPLCPVNDLPAIPSGEGGTPFVDKEVVSDKLREGDYLLIIAGDRLDGRAVKLSASLLGRHLVRGWDLALVEVAVFQREPDPERQEHLLVPHLRGVLVAERRQVVRVEVKGDETRVTVEPTAPVAVSRPKWTEEQFFAAAEHAPAHLRDFANELRSLRGHYTGITFRFGTAKDGSLVFEKEGTSILEFLLGYSGSIRFRPKNEAGEDNFVKALGEKIGQHYRKRLEEIFPRSMKMNYPFADFRADHAEKVLPLLREVLEQSVEVQSNTATAA